MYIYIYIYQDYNYIYMRLYFLINNAKSVVIVIQFGML